MKKVGLRRILTGIILIIVTTGTVGCGRKTPEPLVRSAFLLNTFVSITLYDRKDEALLDECMELCQKYEGLFSKTIETSEIYQMNHRKPGERTFTVSEETAEVVKKGLEYSCLSGGAFDITIEPVSALWDFTGQNPEIPSEELLGEALKNVGWQNVEAEGNKITFKNDETTMDLGAIAKGYIADRLKEYLAGRGVESGIINLGGNVLCIGKNPNGQPFQIGVQKPYGEQQETVAALSVEDKSVVSSGVYMRHFEKDGVNYHHILNPETGYPYNNGLLQVTIISDLSVDGDGLSTSCFALGLEKGMELVDSLDNVSAIFMTEDGELHYSKDADEWQ